RRVRHELGLQVRELAVALTEDRHVGHGFAKRFCRSFRGPAAREEPQGPSVSGLQQATDLVDLGCAETVPSRRREGFGAVEAALLGVVERGTDIDASP